MVQAVDIIGPEFTGQECAPLSIGGLSTRPGPLAVFADEPVADPINVADRGFQRLQDCHEPYEIRGLEVGNDVEVTRFEIYSVHPCGSGADDDKPDVEALQRGQQCRDIG